MELTSKCIYLIIEPLSKWPIPDIACRSDINLLSTFQVEKYKEYVSWMNVIFPIQLGFCFDKHDSVDMNKETRQLATFWSMMILVNVHYNFIPST